MSVKSPGRAPAAPSRVPAPFMQPQAGLEQQNLIGNAAIQQQMAKPEAAQEETQSVELLGMHMVETKAGPRRRLVVSFQDEGFEGGDRHTKVDYIEGLYFAEASMGAPVLVERKDGKDMVLAMIDDVRRRLGAMATTGRLRLTPEQRAEVEAKIARVAQTVERTYGGPVEQWKGAGRRFDREKRIYDGLEVPTEGDYTGVEGQNDVMKTEPSDPKKPPPEKEPTAKEPPKQPATPEKPATPESKPPTPGAAPPTVRVQFEQNEAKADPKALAALQAWCDGDHEFVVTAYASAEGHAAYNLALSQRRADWVEAVLAGMGATHVSARGQGEEGQDGLDASEKGRPAADKQAARQQWRRADVTVRRRPGPNP